MAVKIASVMSYYNDVIRDNEFTQVLHLSLGNIVIRVHTNSDRLIHDMRSYFTGFITEEEESHIEIYALESDPVETDLDFIVKTPDPGKTKIKEEYANLSDGRVVKKVLTGMLFVFNGRENVAAGPCVENSNQVINFINNRYIELLLQRGCLLFHAAGVLNDSKGIVLSGFSGAGKSTLALHMMSEGYSFLSNDRIMVENTRDKLFMYGIPKLPRINPGTIMNNPDLTSIITEEEREEFKKLPNRDLWELEHKYDARIDEIFGQGKFKLFSEMDTLVIMSWKHNGEPLKLGKINISNRPDLYPAFMKSPGLFFRADEEFTGGMQPEESYVDALNNCDVYELSGGVDFKNAVIALQEISK